MKRALLAFLVLALNCPPAACAQLHGSYERMTRPRTPGLRDGSIEKLLVEALEHTHKAAKWKQHQVAELHMQLTLGDADPIQVLGRFDTEGSGFILSIDGQPMLGHDGNGAWQSPAAAELGDAEVHVRMLATLPAMPYRLRDERVIYRSSPMIVVEERRYHAMTRLWPDNDNWTILLVDSHTNMLHAAAYFIRTSAKDEPEFSPAFAMIAQEYREADGVPIARRWEIWRWSRPRGPIGDGPVGEVGVKQVRFIEREAGAFARPESAVDIPLQQLREVDESGSSA